MPLFLLFLKWAFPHLSAFLRFANKIWFSLLICSTARKDIWWPLCYSLPQILYWHKNYTIFLYFPTFYLLLFWQCLRCKKKKKNHFSSTLYDSNLWLVHHFYSSLAMLVIYNNCTTSINTRKAITIFFSLTSFLLSTYPIPYFN